MRAIIYFTLLILNTAFSIGFAAEDILTKTVVRYEVENYTGTFTDLNETYSQKYRSGFYDDVDHHASEVHNFTNKPDCKSISKHPIILKLGKYITVYQNGDRVETHMIFQMQIEDPQIQQELQKTLKYTEDIEYRDFTDNTDFTRLSAHSGNFDKDIFGAAINVSTSLVIDQLRNSSTPAFLYYVQTGDSMAGLLRFQNVFGGKQDDFCAGKIHLQKDLL